MILFCILFSYKRNEKQKMQVTQHKLHSPITNNQKYIARYGLQAHKA